MRLLMTFATLTAVAACGGAETSVDQLARLTDLEAETMRLSTLFDDLEDDDIRVPLPGSGNGTYAGAATIVMGLGDFDTTQVRTLAVGDFNATVDFPTGVVTGEATDFISVENAQDIVDDNDVEAILGSVLTGSVSLAGLVDGTMPAATISGTLTDPEFATLTFTDVNADAELFGLDQNILRADAESNATFDTDEEGWFEFEALGQRQ